MTKTIEFKEYSRNKMLIRPHVCARQEPQYHYLFKPYLYNPKILEIWGVTLGPSQLHSRHSARQMTNTNLLFRWV